MTNTALSTIFLASLLGSPHCAGMCGGFVALYSSRSPRARLPHLAYNVGRLFTYSLLGLTAGFIGQSIDEIAQVRGYQNALTVIFASLMICWGLLGIFPYSPMFLRKLSAQLGPSLSAPFRMVLKEYSQFSPTTLAFLLGTFSTLLPCGWLYLYVAAAATTASPIHGLLLMIVFWTGTLPLMISLGLLARGILKRFPARLPQLSALLILAVGLFTLLHHVGSSSEEGVLPTCVHHSNH